MDYDISILNGNDFLVTQEYGVNPQDYAKFGYPYHIGLDIVSQTGKDWDIETVLGGTVKYAGFATGGYGNMVIILQDDNVTAKYMHLDTISVKVNQRVEQLQIIGVIGNTGNSTGRHLHLELCKFDGNIWSWKNHFSPLPYLNKLDDNFKDKKNNTQTQQPMNENIKLIVQECINQGLNLTRDKEKVAYILATARHETNNFDTLQEYDGVKQAIRLNYEKNPDNKSLSYHGRGFVQLTHFSNYKKYKDIIESKFGIDIVKNPDSLLENKSACAFILVDGMINGKFTGDNLDSYPYTYKAQDPEVKAGKAKVGEIGLDFWNSRRIVNGTDQADLIAGYANEYLDMINAGSIRVVAPVGQPTQRLSTKEGFKYITDLYPDFLPNVEAGWPIARFDIGGAGEGLKMIAGDVIQPMIATMQGVIAAKEIIINSQKLQIETLTATNLAQGEIIKNKENEINLINLKSGETHYVKDPIKEAEYEAQLEKIKQDKINLQLELQKAKEQAQKQELEKDPLYQKATNGNLFSSTLQKAAAILGTSWVGLSGWFASNGVDLSKISHDPVCQGLAVYGIIITIVAAYLSYKKYLDNKKIKQGYSKALKAPSNMFEDITKITETAKSLIADTKNAKAEFVSVIDSLNGLKK
jgi:hypothetical protein